ncbi:MAG: hypothetical protein IJO06_13620 [Thermoguttaceae bacterium]|nr:hypothetical protein [Thermoguttaceae bacterium]
MVKTTTQPRRRQIVKLGKQRRLVRLRRRSYRAPPTQPRRRRVVKIGQPPPTERAETPVASPALRQTEQAASTLTPVASPALRQTEQAASTLTPVALPPLR